MPLPNGGIDVIWPPAEWQAIYQRYALHAAWYGGDAQELANVYASLLYNPYKPRSAFWARSAQAERRVA